MNPRITAIDSLRGLMIILMILGHLRWIFLPLPVDPIEIDAVPLGVYLTRVMTNFCAPIFFFLSGMSIFLLVRSYSNIAQASRDLIIRGLLLIFLQVAYITLIWNQHIDHYIVMLGVFWALGMSMLVLSILIHFPVKWMAVIAIVTIFGHNLLEYFSYNGSIGSFMLMLLYGQPADIIFADLILIEFAYAIIPWFAVMLLGYVIGSYILTPQITPKDRQGFLLALGLGLLAIFIVLRTLIGYGDDVIWFWQNDNSIYSLAYLFKITKYPPSMQYICLTVGLGCCLLALFDRFKLRFEKYLIVYGQTPLFLFIFHIPIVVMAGMIWDAIAFGPELGYAQEKAVALPWVYLIWLSFLPLFYWACKWYRPMKVKYKHTFLKYI